MLTTLVSLYIVAFLSPWLHRFGRPWTGRILASVPVGLIVYFTRSAYSTAGAKDIIETHQWLTGLGISLSFRLDGLSFFFVLLIAAIGAVILIYSDSYLAGHRQLGRFYAYMLAFMASMLGIVLADNMIALFVFWELTSMTSYLLIGFDHEREQARQAALQALLVTGIGGLALLFGFLMLGGIAGTYEISSLLNRGNLYSAHPLYLPILLLILAGAFTKSAQFPFHFWLPNAMEAPAPVSAYLHSATMVKAGVYLLARLSPALGQTPAWKYLLVGTGLSTMIAGAYLSLIKTDMKRMLAYSTVAALGIMVMLLGLGGAVAMRATLVFLLAHGLYKGALFLAAGAVDHETGIREADRLGGLFRRMPLVALSALLAAMSSAGMPPHIGFIGKELIYESVLREPFARLLAGAVFLTTIAFVAVGAIVSIRPFFGKAPSLPRVRHRPPSGLWLGPVLLAGMGLLAGILPRFVDSRLIAPALSAVQRHGVAVQPALWPGLHKSLLLSAAAFVMGIGLYLGWSRLRRLSERLAWALRWGPARWYSLVLEGTLSLARAQTRLLQSGHLHFYLLIIILTTVGLVGERLLGTEMETALHRWREAYAYETLLAVIIIAAAVVLVRSGSLIGAVVALGVVGFGVAMVFLLFSAPDLAMTQFATEVLGVVLFTFVLLRLPDIETYSTPKERIRDAVPALAAGALMTLLVLTVTALPRETPLTAYFNEHGLSEARGRNLVNVILVDFRGLDTLGEITVLAVAAIGVYSLLKLYVHNRTANGADK